MSTISTSIIDSILDGDFDDELDQIKGAVKERRSQIANRLRFQLRTGDRVRVVGDIRPKYLIGLFAEVKRVNQTTVTIDFEDPESARRFGRGVRMPLSCVEKVGA